MWSVVYTKHAEDKFEVLRRHGFAVTHTQVDETVFNPERVIPQPGGRFVAQRGISEQHVLRVVYREDGDTRVVITFYPGRRERYEA